MISSNALKVKFAMTVEGAHVAAVNLGGQVGFIIGSTSEDAYKQFLAEELASTSTTNYTNTKATTIALWLEEVLSKVVNAIVSVEGGSGNTIKFRHNGTDESLGGANVPLLEYGVEFFDHKHSTVSDVESMVLKLRQAKAKGTSRDCTDDLTNTYQNYAFIRNALISCGANTPSYINCNKKSKKVSVEVQGQINPTVESLASVSIDFVEAVYYLMAEKGFEGLEITRGKKGSYTIKDLKSNLVITKLKYIDGDVNAGSFNHIWYNGKIVNITKFDFKGTSYNTERLVRTFPLANCPHAREVLASTTQYAK